MQVTKLLSLTLSLMIGCAALAAVSGATRAAADETGAVTDARVLRVPDFVGLVLGDSRYAERLKELNAKKPDNAYLVIKSFSQLALDGTTYVYLNVEQHTRLMPQATKFIGQIVGQIALTPGAGPVVQAVYFKPPGEIPGGISVGNQ